MRYSHLLLGGLVFATVGCGGEAITPVDGGTGGSGSKWPSGTGGSDPNEEVEHSNGGIPASGGATGVAGAGGVLGIAGNGGDGGAIGAGGAIGIGGGTTLPGSGGSILLDGFPLIPMNGWLDAQTNALGMQGAVFPFGDDYSTLENDFTGSNVCIAGEAARVDLNCVPEPPATDCWGMYWGTAVGMNLNQPIDPVTEMAVDPPLSYDATQLAGFSFVISGATVPTSLRFSVQSQNGEFCTPPTVPVVPGANTILFSDLKQECWFVDGQPMGFEDTAEIVKLSWLVATNDAGAVPCDFCVSNIFAVPRF